MWRSVRVTVLAAVGCCVPLHGLVAAVGRTTGGASVSIAGEGSYTIPLLVPPGRNGLEPRLALVYAHRTGNGLIGAGWSVSGLSVIARCSRTFAQDGTPATVLLTSADKFCLDGNKLRRTSGTYGTAGSTYQTEIETLAKVTAIGTAGNGPASFEVRRKDGLIYEYGNTADSRIEVVGSNPATPRLWALNRIRDRAGN